jgi:hypothetical protein
MRAGMPVQPNRAVSLSRLLLVAVLAILMPLVVAARASAAQPGVVSDLTWWIPDTDKQSTITAMTDAGVRWTRLGIGWHDLEPSKGSYSTANLQEDDKAIQMAHAAGIKIVLDIVETPQWASGSTNRYAAPRNPQDLADFVRFIANRYRGQVDGYEIWNEENISRFWPSGPSPSAYTAMLQAAYPAIKSVDPNSPVLFGGLSTNDYHYLEGAYAAGAKGYFDGMAVHPYSCRSPDTYDWVDANGNKIATGGPKPNATARISQYSYLGYREIRNTMLANGDDKPIWFTEFGWSTSSTGSCTVDQQTQASYLTRAYQLAAQDPYVPVALWYNFREDFWGDPATDYDSGFGLLHKDFSAKPAYSAFRDYAMTGGSSSGSTGSTGSISIGGSGTTGTTTTGTTTTTTTGSDGTSGTITSGTTSGGATTTTAGGKRKKKRARAARARRARASARRGR